MWELAFQPKRVQLGELADVLPVIEGEGLDLRYGSRVYVAYLDEEARLLSCYAIQLMHGEDAAAAVASDAQRQRQLCQVIVGQAAELLFLGISGRLAWEPIRAANPLRALQARSILAYGIGREPGFDDAYAAVADWGDHIYPWYGAVALDENTGRLILGLPEYDHRVDLPMVAVNVD